MREEGITWTSSRPLGDPALCGDVFLLRFPLPPGKPGYTDPAAELGKPEAGLGGLPRCVGCFTRPPLAALPELSFLLWGFFFFHLHSTLSFPSANVKGH